jgi:hypothetical protein
LPGKKKTPAIRKTRLNHCRMSLPVSS